MLPSLALCLLAYAAPPAPAASLDLPALLGGSTAAVYRTLGRCEVARATPLSLSCALRPPRPAPTALVDFDDAMQVRAITLTAWAPSSLAEAVATADSLLALLGASPEERRVVRAWGRPGPAGHQFVVSRPRLCAPVRLRAADGGGWRVSAEMTDPAFRARTIPTWTGPSGARESDPGAE